METGIMILLGVLAILIIYYTSTYNKLTKAKNSVLEANSGIDIALLKRFDLITDLVEVVKGYSKHEVEILKSLTEIRSNIHKNPDVANGMLNDVVNKINMTIEAYPDLKASEQYLNLQKNMTNVEEHLQAARRLYNANVTAYNNLTEQFPSSFIANIHKFERENLFKTDVTNLEKPIVEF